MTPHTTPHEHITVNAPGTAQQPATNLPTQEPPTLPLRPQTPTQQAVTSYSCVQCHKPFSRLSNLRRHVKNVHTKDTTLIPVPVPTTSSPGSGNSLETKQHATPREYIAVISPGTVQQPTTTNIPAYQPPTLPVTPQTSTQEPALSSVPTTSIKTTNIQAHEPPTLSVSPQTPTQEPALSAAPTTSIKTNTPVPETSTTPLQTQQSITTAHTCAQCGKSFSRVDSLRRHVTNVHQTTTTATPVPVPTTTSAISGTSHTSIPEISSTLATTSVDTTNHTATQETSSTAPQTPTQQAVTTTHTCSQCGKSFSRVDNLRRHVKSVHPPTIAQDQSSSAAPNSPTNTRKRSVSELDTVQTANKKPAPRYNCNLCHKTFAWLKDMQRHKRNAHCKQQYMCQHCTRPFTLLTNMQRHIKNIHLPPKPSTAPTTTPIDQPSTSGTQTLANKHPRKRAAPASKAAAKYKRPKSLYVKAPNGKVIWRDDESATIETLPTDIQQVYVDNWQAIRTHSRGHTNMTTYTHFHSPTETVTQDWASHLNPIFNKLNKRIKINLSHHLILRHCETKELKFFHASVNNACVLDKPVLISNRADFDAFLTDIADVDAFSYALHSRPDTKWLVEGLPATSFYIFHLNDFPIGCLTDEEIPPSIRNNQNIYILQRDANNPKDYDDNKCVFRCLALHKGAALSALNMPTRELWRQWCTHHHIPEKTLCPGITLVELPVLENLFKIKIDVFEYREKDQALAPKVRSGNTVYEDTMYVLHFKDHFMYISDINAAGHAFCCAKCSKLFGLHRDLTRHEKTCNGGHPKDSYSGGVYTPPPTIWETISSHGVKDVPVNFIYPYRATFDYESYFNMADLPTVKARKSSTKYTARHVPLSCSVASNVPKFEEPSFFVNEGDPQDLVTKMLQYLEQVADAAYRLLSDKFAYIKEQLTHLEMPDLITRFDDYLRQLPVIGFNSGKYDVNVIKPYLVKYFVDKAEGLTIEEDDTEAQTAAEDIKEKKAFNYVVKRNNNFMCLATKKLKMLDIVNYIAPGFSYSKYLASYQIPEQKGVFCYEYITALKQLDEPALPEHEAFYSKLKNANISEEEYAECQKVWAKHKMATLKDFLKWYNNKDVVPFLAALEKQVAFYGAHGVDMFKDAISVPGITLKFLFKTLPRGVMFSLCSEKQKALHTTMRNNITGGPSIIFHRYHEKDVTFIRGNAAKVVKTILGFDANALYLSALMQPMPTDFPVIRRAGNDFRAERVSFYSVQNRQWLSWVSHTKDIHLQTQYNGREMSLGKRRLRVDGWDSVNRTAYQFHGCMFHGHPNCPLTKGKDTHPKTDTPLAELYAKTVANRAYLEAECNVQVIEMWECEWQALKKARPDIQSYLKATFNRVKPSYTNKVTPTEDQIIEAVKDGSLFGLVECNIEVPDVHKEKFSEMTPIFKNIEVSRKDIGAFMQAHAEKHNILNGPRRTLIGSYKGVEILLATPLLKWYLMNGLEVTKIHQVIEYHPKACFKQFGDTVTEARRDGDRDPSCAIKSETMKLLGNAAYGKTLTNKSKHLDVAYVRGEGTSKLINNPRFKKMTEVTNGVFEVETLKQKIRWDLPLQIGFFVYQYAKLRMLEFYYDFLAKFVDKADFQLCEMDTDSLYMALSAPTLEEVVKADMKKEFYEVYGNWFPREACNSHSAEFIAQSGKRYSDCVDCRQVQMYDKRTPGLFKLEYEGDGIISLCSKTYHCFGACNKTSCKGLNKAHNKLDKTLYLKVLDNEESEGGTNISFRSLNNQVFSYEQHRQSLSFFYIKRKVDKDKVTTSPLDI
ncbi:hypothetical protein BsWGS_16899 [Bradybaena similaris]